MADYKVTTTERVFIALFFFALGGLVGNVTAKPIPSSTTMCIVDAHLFSYSPDWKRVDLMHMPFVTGAVMPIPVTDRRDPLFLQFTSVVKEQK